MIYKTFFLNMNFNGNLILRHTNCIPNAIPLLVFQTYSHVNFINLSTFKSIFVGDCHFRTSGSHPIAILAPRPNKSFVIVGIFAICQIIWNPRQPWITYAWFFSHRNNGGTVTIIQTLHEQAIKTKSVDQQVGTTGERYREVCGCNKFIYNSRTTTQQSQLLYPCPLDS